MVTFFSSCFLKLSQRDCHCASCNEAMIRNFVQPWGSLEHLAASSSRGLVAQCPSDLCGSRCPGRVRPVCAWKMSFTLQGSSCSWKLFW